MLARGRWLDKSNTLHGKERHSSGASNKAGVTGASELSGRGHQGKRTTVSLPGTVA